MGAIGGRAHEGLTATVFNAPVGRHSVSLFAHHSDDDTIVPPGPDQDPTVRVQSTWTPLPGPSAATGMPAAEVPRYTGSFRTLSAAVTAYGCTTTAARTRPRR